MADSLNQNEIDELLNANIGLDESGPEPEQFVRESKVNSKVFKRKKDTALRFVYQYRSPVIKKENVIYNPSNGMQSSNGKVVVRDLKNYALYHRKRSVSFY